MAVAKGAQDQSANPADLHCYPFYRPNHADAWQVIVVDVDADKNAGETPADALARITAPGVPRPHWIITTNKGAQAGWLIEDVSTRPGASVKAQEYARDVALRLRHAVRGDISVDPLTAHRVRNPLFVVLGDRLQAFPMAPYMLAELHWTLHAAGLWTKRLAGERQPQGREYAGVNDEVNARAWFTVRRELETGKRERWTEAQVLDLVKVLNLEAAARQRSKPQTDHELRHMAASITRYQHRPGTRRAGQPGGTTAEQAERGAKGGSAGTLAQKRQRQDRAAKGTTVRSAAKALRDEQIRIMRWEDGKTNAEIADALGVSIRTVQNAFQGCNFRSPKVSGLVFVPPAVAAPADPALPTPHRGTAGVPLASGTTPRPLREGFAATGPPHQPDQPRTL